MKVSGAAVSWVAFVIYSSAAWAEGDVNFTLTNTSAQSLTGFFAGLSGEGDVNLLTTTLSPSSSIEVTIPLGQDACVRNLRIVFADETVQERPDVDLCNMDGYLVE